MEGLNIILRKNGNGSDAQFRSGACDPNRDFAAIRNQQGLNTHETLSAPEFIQNIATVQFFQSIQEYQFLNKAQFFSFKPLDVCAHRE